jgi:hypothetical protein
MWFNAGFTSFARFAQSLLRESAYIRTEGFSLEFPLGLFFGAPTGHLVD